MFSSSQSTASPDEQGYDIIVQKLSHPQHKPHVGKDSSTRVFSNAHHPRSSQLGCKFIYITGSVGKTSLALNLESMLLNNGVKVSSWLGESHCEISPFCESEEASSSTLQHWYFTIRENMRVNGEIVSKEEYVRVMRPVVEKRDSLQCPSMRQQALEYFVECDSDFVIVEGREWPWRDMQPSIMAVMPVEEDDLNAFSDEAIRASNGLKVYTLREQPGDILEFLQIITGGNESFLHIMPPFSGQSITEENQLFAQKISSDLMQPKPISITSPPLIPCRMEETLWKKATLLLDQAQCFLSIERLILYAERRFSTFKNIIFVMGFETSPTSQDKLKRELSQRTLDRIQKFAAHNHSECTVSVVFLRSNHTSALDTQWIESYVGELCTNMQLIPIGLKNYSDEGLELLEAHTSQEKTAIVSFGSPHLIAEMRRNLVRRKLISAEAPSYCLKPDRFFEYERDRLMVKYMKQNALLQGVICNVKSFGWILQFLKENKVRYMIGSNFGLNNSCAAEFCRDKAATSTILAMHEIPHVEHMIFVNPNQSEFHSDAGVWDSLKRCFEKLNRNIVVKPKEGSEGVGVARVTNQRELEVQVQNLFSRHRDFCICPFYDIASEIRCIMIDHKCLLMYRKEIPFLVGDGKSTNLQLFLEYEKRHKSLLNRESKGGSQIPAVVSSDPFIVPPNQAKLPLSWKFNLSGGHMLIRHMNASEFPRHVSMAQSATRALRLRFASVDLIETKNGELRVLEVNSCVWLSKYSLRQSAEGGSETARIVYGEALKAMFIPSDD
eukprot:CAMPEP_0117450982 /NCGR_PEP_ID=MMETSP0759-20121206/8762_1 /TAXON_ID=63605 /ORGANISM="Percolomonas cosmopolitus, Strain WS" /LENGTH=780 /DNA_ID=CAMNT_0005243547 /DNA_START=496 /DNA_END=2835 /DNA_ORIENTATION=+